MNAIESNPPVSPSSDRTWLAWLAWLATEDHCEWANKYVQWVKSPLGILLVSALFSLLCGLFVATQAFLLLAVILAVVFVGLAWPSIAVRGVRCRLVFTSARGREGKPTQAKLIIANRWPWPVWGLAVEDPAFAKAVGACCSTQETGRTFETPVALARIDGWSRSSFHWNFIPPLRGIYPNRQVQIVTGFPFGLHRASRRVEVDRCLTVWPETFWLPPLEQRHSRQDWSGELSESLVGTDGTRLGVRDYRQGDNVRDIHWAKSARHERLIVSEREASVVENYRVIVDVDPSSHTGTGSGSTLEWALKIAASICESVATGRGRVELWLGEQRIVASGGKQLVTLLDDISRFDPAALPSKPAPTASRQISSAHLIHVGTDAAQALSGRSIVLNRGAFSPQTTNQEASEFGWITIDSTGDIPGQILRGWRATRRRLRRAK